MMTKLEKIVIIGAGTMGVGIAQVAAMSGFKVVLFDIEPENLPKAMQRIARRLIKALKNRKLRKNKKKIYCHALMRQLFLVTFMAILL